MVRDRWRDFGEHDINLIAMLPSNEQIVKDITFLVRYIDDNCYSDNEIQEIEDEAFNAGYEEAYAIYGEVNTE